MIDFDKFQNDFNFAQTAEEKKKMLEDINDDVNFSEEELKEFYEQINDLVQNNLFEEDKIISLEIEQGKYQLYSCIKSTKSIDDVTYKSGSNYYVKVDDPREIYAMTGIGETNTAIQNMIDSIKPIYYVITDDGIGTLKRKNIFPKDFEFSEHFIKFV